MAKKDFICGFYPQFKLAECCGGDYLRAYTKFIAFIGDYAYATDGHIAVRARITDICNFGIDEIERLYGKFLMDVQFKELQKMSHAKVAEDGSAIVCDELYKQVLFPLSSELPDGSHFPDVEKIFADTISRVDGVKLPNVTKIGIKPELIMRAKKALDAVFLRLDLTTETSAVLVRDADDNVTDIMCIIMPKVLEK